MEAAGKELATEGAANCATGGRIRCEYEGIFLDYSRQQATGETIEKLLKLAEVAKLKEKIEKMFKGEKINSTENRLVLHVALRAPRDAVINSDGTNVVPEVGATRKPLTNFVSVGIGGSFLGPLFVHTALQIDPEAAECAKGRQLIRLDVVQANECLENNGVAELDKATNVTSCKVFFDRHACC